YGPVVEGIYLMRVDGTGLTPLVQQEYVTQPAWSPQGSKIAYDGPDGLYVVNADGSGQPELLWPGSVTLSPTWSPNASKIAFEDNWSIQIL
ncbi:MAG: hypothetical protein GWO23_03400, partial [Gammaproteobacteria bacterium]|nr:hypothetical protein [Gammaproteobacteria bacterium]